MNRMNGAACLPLLLIAVIPGALVFNGCGGDRKQDPPTSPPAAQQPHGDEEHSVLMGQSGSEAVPGELTPVAAAWAPCPCSGARTWLKATVLALNGADIQLRLEELLSGAAELAVGEQLTGEYSGQLLCGGTVCQELSVGDTVLASYAVVKPPRPVCSAYDACLESCRAELAAARPRAQAPVADTCPQTCEAETEAECPAAPPPDPARARLGVVRWQDPLVLAQTAEEQMLLPLDRVSVLWAPEVECNAQWPTPFSELRGYPVPHYSQELEKLVFVPAEPECR